jgi:hypothetical protein
VEISALNIASAAANAQRNKIDNCRFVAGTAEDIFAEVKPSSSSHHHRSPSSSSSSSAASSSSSSRSDGGRSGGSGGGGGNGGGFDPLTTAVVIDPPRKGCSEEFLDQLLDFAPARVVYVSCDPVRVGKQKTTSDMAEREGGVPVFGVCVCSRMSERRLRWGARICLFLLLLLLLLISFSRLAFSPHPLPPILNFVFPLQATQARDAAVMLASKSPKYEVTDCTPFDLFPQTRHIENVMTFDRCAW